MLINTIIFVYKKLKVIPLNQIWFISLLSVFQTINAQDCVAINFNSQNGLPSDEVHDLCQDELGKIWAATDMGLVKFDGQKVTVYDASCGLNSSVVFNLFVQSKTRIWVSTIKNELYSFNPLADQIQFTPFKHKETLDSLFRINPSKKYIRQIWLDSFSNLHLSFLRESGKIVIYKNGKGEITGEPRKTSNVKSIIAEFASNLELRYSSNDTSPYGYLIPSTGNENDLRLQLINEVTKEQHELSSVDLDFTKRSMGVADFHHSPNIDLIIFENRLVIITKKNTYETQLQSTGYALLCYQNLILVGTSDGIEIYDRAGKFHSKHFKHFHITSLMQDLSGKIWFSTLNNGVFLIPNFEIRIIKNNDRRIGKIITIHVDEDFVYVFSSEGKFHILNHQGVVIDEYQGVNAYREIISSEEDIDFSRFFGPHLLNGEIYTAENRTYNLCRKNESTFLRIGSNTIFRYKQNQLDYFKEDQLPIINAACEISEHEILIGTNKGLYKLDNFQTIRPIYPNNKYLNGRLLEINKIGKNVLITTESSGLILLERNKLTSISTSCGLVSNKIIALKIQSDNTFWVGTPAGLSRVVLKGSEKNEPDIENFTIENGLPSNEIYDIDYYRDSLWIATKHGVCYFPWTSLEENIDLKTYPLLVDSIQVNNRFYEFSEQVISIRESDVLEIYVTQISYGLMNSLRYEYKVEGYLSDWIQSDNGHFLVSGLEHGEYTLEYRCIKSDQSISKIKALTIKVKTPWYKLTTVRLLALFMLFILLFFINRLISYRIKIKNDLKVEKVNLELRVLVGQMNPHFMFNTINSIQSFILLNDKKEALDYLSNFALLIRTTLDFSRKKVIRWKEEKAFLKLYVSLESERFEQDILIAFEENFTSPIETIGFPPLLLQPLVENSIIHGIQGSVNKGEIKISIQETKNSYILSISNNGRVMNESDQYKAHQSHGLAILKRRIALYNRTKKGELSIMRSKTGETIVRFNIQKTTLHIS